tara:strand:+ start:147 stop:335 length:189 start_codon:yes stop_codon:yes gene_type:complete
MDAAEAANPYAAIVPKFDLAQAKRLFFKGRSLEELTAAAKRLGGAKLEEELRAFAQELEGEL